MASRRDFYYRQLVTEAELDASNDDLEAADRSLVVDAGVFGALTGLEVAEAPSPNLTVNVGGPGVGYDQLGQRVAITATQNKDVSVDYLGATTAVATPGNEKWVSLFIKFARTLSDPRVDGNSNTVYFVRTESFTLHVVQGAEAGVGAAAKPGLLTDGFLLADINRTNGQTQILNADISVARRQDYLRIAGSPNSLARGRVKDAISDLLALINVVSTTVPSTAGGINYAGGGAWADGTANPAQTVEAWIDGAISGFAATTGSSGADKIGVKAVTGPAGSTLVASTLQTRLANLQDATNLDTPARSAWRGGRTNPATTVLLALSKIVDDLGLQTASDDGAERIGAQSGNGFSAGSVRSQLDEVAPGAAGTAYSATKTFNGAAGDTNAALQTTSTPTARKLLWSIDVGALNVRLYGRANASGGEALEITVNAVWGGASWSADDTSAAASVLSIGIHTGGGRDAGLLRKASTVGTWTTWDSELRFRSGDPGASTVGYTNTLTNKNLVKAWGFIDVVTGTATVQDGFNVTSVSMIGDDVSVTLADDMGNANYAVVATNRSSNGYAWEAYFQGTGGFRLRARNLTGAGAQVALSGGSGSCSFVVLGTQ